MADHEDHGQRRPPLEKKELSLTKAVTGAQGATDQYFPFTVTLTFPAGSTSLGETLTPTGADSVADAGRTFLYGETPGGGFSNLTPKTITETTVFTFWLKHGESVTIGNIPADMAYFSVFELPSAEGDNIQTWNKTYYIDGYTVSNVLTYDDETGTPVSVPGTKPLTSDFQAFHTNDKVTFTNDKDTATPIGVLLQAAAPIAGVALALALAAVVLLGKKRRRDRA